MTNHALKTIADSYKDLSEIESFDPSAFVFNDKASQELCDLMLSLSLFCNDIKDTIMFQILTENDKPESSNEISTARGQYGWLNGSFSKIICFVAGRISLLA